MSLAKHYNPHEAEPRWLERWQAAGIYHFNPAAPGRVFSIDTPPATVSGNLHLGHVYSYSHPDFVARFWRMRGNNIYYPMGYDDNGLPTERLVERRLGIRAQQVGRTAFIDKCLQVSEEAEKDYELLWKRLGLSIDWRHTYRTIDSLSRRISQDSFLDLYRKGLAYRREAPAIWCPECRTAIAQAELKDLSRPGEFVILPFYFEDQSRPSPTRREGGWGSEGEQFIPIATTRPELLPACVAVFVHPGDGRFQAFVGRRMKVPYFGQVVPVLADSGADPEKGTGAVMCCTFGDTTDVAWWYAHKLPLIEAIDRGGRMSAAAGVFADLPLEEARREIKNALAKDNLLLGRVPTEQSVRVHERCDTPVEYIVTRQWFIRVLDFKEELLKAGQALHWHPESMQARYRAWVENLNWDWCISRQRYYGVPIPVWYCNACGEVMLAEQDQLPVDPLETRPRRSCRCGSSDFLAEEDVFDTWATSSMSPQIVGRWLEDEPFYQKVFPFSLRPQAHEIIRTWAFYTLVKSHFHFHALPWSDALISGWGIAGEGMGKISKSRGGGPMPPLEMIDRYSADAVRYWASSTSPGKDAVISEEKIGMGAKLVTKLWNVARFSERFLAEEPDRLPSAHLPGMTPADRWILSRLQKLVRRVTGLMENYDYAAAKSEVEAFFWRELADNYLEMCKQRLYESQAEDREAARRTLSALLLTILKLFAPFLPFVTEEIYQGLWGRQGGDRKFVSIHSTQWPEPVAELESDQAETVGAALVEIATAIRRYKSERNLPLGQALDRVQLSAVDPRLSEALPLARNDLMSISRARQIEVVEQFDPSTWVIENNTVKISIELNANRSS